MTLYLTFTAIENGSLNLHQVLQVSGHAAGQVGSRLGLTAEDNITVQDAILAVIIRSGNDAAMVLAEAVGGNEAAFVKAMNKQAEVLGLDQSHFINPTGLPDPRQVTSARDMAVLAAALWRHYPQHYHFFAARRMTFGKHNLPTINGFVVSYRGADGLKTGTNCDAGYNLVASAQRDGIRLIGVVLGARNSAARSAIMSTLFDAGFSSAAEEHGIDIASLKPSPNDTGPTSSNVARNCQMSAQSGRVKAPMLPGWAIVVGSYAQQFHAQRAAELVSISTGLSKIGRPMIVPLKNRKYYAALIIGLDEYRAAKACLAVRRSGANCVALRPDELNDPNAGWRE